MLEREFSAGDGEVTPTLKLKGKAIERELRAEIDAAATAPSGSQRRYRRIGPARADRTRAPSTTLSPRLEILTTSPVCGAWMNWPPPM